MCILICFYIHSCAESSDSLLLRSKFNVLYVSDLPHIHVADAWHIQSTSRMHQSVRLICTYQMAICPRFPGVQQLNNDSFKTSGNPRQMAEVFLDRISDRNRWCCQDVLTPQSTNGVHRFRYRNYIKIRSHTLISTYL